MWLGWPVTIQIEMLLMTITTFELAIIEQSAEMQVKRKIFCEEKEALWS